MKRSVSALTSIILLGLFFTGCLTTAELGQGLYEFRSEDLMVMSRGIEIPATVVLPSTGENVKFPLVVMAHGHGGGRQENGGFALIAEKLASSGIATIRMDFAGSGDSSESWLENNITNMLADIKSSRDYMLANYEMIDKKRVGIFGYSMGGRLAIHSAAVAPGDWKAMGLLAPSGDKGDTADFLGGYDTFHERMNIAEKDGFYLFKTPWGQEQQLSYKFYKDMENSDPEVLIKDYKGPVLVIAGDKDVTVPMKIGQAVLDSAVNAESAGLHVVKGADHGYGFYSDQKDLAEEVADTLADFFIANL